MISLSTVRRVLNKRPGYVARRVLAEMHRQADRWGANSRAQRLTEAALLQQTGDSSLAELWERLATKPYLSPRGEVCHADYEKLCPGDADRIFAQAEAACRHDVDMLGSGPISLGQSIDWMRDFKVNMRWEPGYFASIEYNNPERPSDVKVPWELSRMQWLLPMAQAYRLSGDEKYAVAARDVLEQWIAANPYAYTVNWSCTMDVALRILSWTCLFHTFARSRAWSDESFRSAFLRSLYLHADFTARHLEISDINGNHLASDAAGLVFAGCFFGQGSEPQRWLELGWWHLCRELPLQVHPDGVDFEASVAYHRLVTELFLLPALYRRRCGLDVPEAYRQKLVAMAAFIAAYSRPDGTSPLWADADDGRALPLGGQALLDHRYLVGIVGALWSDEILRLASGPVDEAFWLLGKAEAEGIAASGGGEVPSTAFRDGGFYVMRNRGGDHVFIDCGPVGTGGRGGHGHNDALSFEAYLCGVPLVTDCGAYVYTASYAERNRFRSTACHNTPQVGGEEINRYYGPELIWLLHDDARPELRKWSTTSNHDTFIGSHRGYMRLAQPVRPVRSIQLDHLTHRLEVRDEFEGATDASVSIPLHFSPEVAVETLGDQQLSVTSRGRRFLLRWSDQRDWSCAVEVARVSPSYGQVRESKRALWTSTRGAAPLTVIIEPAQEGARA